MAWPSTVCYLIKSDRRYLGNCEKRDKSTQAVKNSLKKNNHHITSFFHATLLIIHHQKHMQY